MRLISIVDPNGTGLSSPHVRAIANACSEYFCIPNNVHKILSKVTQRERLDLLADSYLSRYSKGKDVLILPGALPKSAKNAKKAIVMEAGAEITGSVREALKEYAYYDISLPRRFFTRMEIVMRTLAHASKILIFSEYAKKTYEKAGYGDVYNIGQGVDTERFRPAVMPPENFQALIISSLKPLKGIRYLVDAWKKKPFPLKFVGEISSPVRKTIPKGIELIGFSEPLQHYQKASCLVLPTLTECFSRVILEAMACGLPVITTHNSGGTDIIKSYKNGIIIPVKDSKAIREAVQYIKDNPPEAKLMGTRARETAEMNTWEHLTQRVKKEIS
jgi:glycosyltransferase involved in cell wall biosynthesis